MRPTRATILLIDDQAAIRDFMRSALEHLGYDVIEAQNGYEGLQLYQTGSIDAVISDIHMPRMNGLEMIRAILQYDPEAIVIAMSSDPTQLPLAHLAGAQQTLAKPLNLRELPRVLATCLELTA